MKKRNNIKEAVVLFTAMIMILSSIVAVANTGDSLTTSFQSLSSDVEQYTPTNPLNRGIVWDNGGDDLTGNTLSSQLDAGYPFNSHVADDFELTTAADIDGVHWWGGFWNGAGYPVTTEFNIYFFADDGTGNMPTGAGMADPSSTALATYNFPSVTGTAVGTDRYEYDVVLPTPFSADAGTKYWLSCQWVGSFSTYGQWGWCANGANPELLADSVQGFPLLAMPYWTLHGYGDTAFYLSEGSSQPAVPDLDCSGELDFIDVEPNGTVSGTITVENIGDENSLLDWEIESFPEWGTWTFDPDSGTDLLEGDTVEITVDIVAPDEPEETFTGEVVLVNSEDPDDTCTIQVSLVTPVSQSYSFLDLLAQRFPILAKILAMIL